MKPSVRRALDRLSSLSAETAQLVSSVKDVPIDGSQEDLKIESLQNMIATLQRELETLKMELAPPKKNLSEADMYFLTTNFRNSLTEAKDIKQAILSYSRREFFLQYTPPVRVALATILQNFCTTYKLLPADLWSDIIAEMGYL